MAVQPTRTPAPQDNTKMCGSVGVEKNSDPCSEISLKDFLDFLCTAYQIAEAIEGTPNDVSNKAGVDWNHLTKNQLISHLYELEEMGKSPIETQPPVEETVPFTDSIADNILEFTKNRNGDKRKNFLMFQRMQSISIDCLRNVDDAVVPKMSMPLERRLSTGSVALENDFTLKTPIVESKSNAISSSPQPPPQPVTVDSLMKQKLNDVLQEGILDSVLPYLVPKPFVSSNMPMSMLLSKSSTSSTETKKSCLNQDSQTNECGEKGRNRVAPPTQTVDGSKPDLEVEIHVCDEVKNLKKDFRCPQKLLVSKMGYFAEVTTGQKLEDMDISVHCDLNIFDWLMRWVKKDLNPHESPPTLDASNVVPILVSAAFLQMEPLMQDCLRYCHKNMNNILRTSTNLACLNDSILTKLANLYSNSDVELLRDKKDRVQSRIFCKLISVLAEPKADPRRGHYASLAALFKCSRCGKLILRQLGGRIACKPGSSRLDRNGVLHGNHAREPSWNLSDYIKTLKTELKSWRRVYWRLWGDCHFQFCSLCHSHYPIYQRNWCLHHVDPPQFFSMENQRTLSYPIGRYPCCGERVYRFEVVRSSTGCNFRAHQPLLQSTVDSEVERIFQAHNNVIAVDPPPVSLSDRLSRLVASSSRDPDEGISLGTGNHNRIKDRDAHWWDGLELAPPRTKHGLLGRVWDSYQQRLTRASSPVSTDTSSSGPTTKTPNLKKQMSIAEPASGSTNGAVSGSTGIGSSLEHDTSSDISSSESEEVSEENSEESCHTRFRPIRQRRRKTGTRRSRAVSTRPVDMGPQWVSKLSTRNNQDNQREYEERAVRHMAALLTRRTSGVPGSGAAAGGQHRSSHHHHHHHHHGHHHHHHHHHHPHHHSMWNGHYTPPGGTYVRIEAEWREQHAGYSGSSGRSRPSTSSHSLTRQKSKSNR